MKNRKIELIISVAAIIISIVAISVSIDAFSMSDSAYFGWIIAVLSTLVLLLIGWDIYKVFDINKKIDEKIEKYKQDSESELNNSIMKVKEEIADEADVKIAKIKKDADVDVTIARAFALSINAAEWLLLKRYRASIDSTLEEIRLYLYLKNKYGSDYRDDIIDRLTRIRNVKDLVECGNIKIKIGDEKKEWIAVLAEANKLFNVMDIIDFVTRLEYEECY